MHDLLVALEGVPGSFDPHTSNNLYSHTVLWAICEPLFDVKASGIPVPGLIAHWPTPSGLTYTFQLRQRVTFHDATPLDGKAVADNLARAAALQSFRGLILRDLVDISRIQHSGLSVTIPLRYEKPELLYLALMASPNTFGSGMPVGTGPFALYDQTSQAIALIGYPQYWRGAPKLESLTFQVSANPAHAARELLRGRVHLARAIDPIDVPLILHAQKHETRTASPFGIYYMGFHLGSQPFDDVRVRRAFRDAIDLGPVEYDLGLDPAAGPLPPNVEAYDPSLSRASPQPAAAKNVLQPACRGIVVPLLFNQHSWYARHMARSIKHDLAQAGVTVDLQGIAGSNALVADIQTRKGQSNPFLFLYNWYSIMPAAEIFLRPLFEGGMPDNLTGYKGADAILSAARRPMSVAARIQLYRQAQATIINDVPAVFLGHPRIRVSAHRNDVSGIGPSSLNVQSFPVDRFHGVDVP